MEDTRNTARHRVLKAATIAFSDTTIECLVRNLSATGAALEIKSPLWFPDTFKLITTSDGGSRSCRVVWRDGRRIGVTFAD